MNYKTVEKDHAEVLKGKPWWRSQHTKLQKLFDNKFPGTHLVAFPGDMDEINSLISENLKNVRIVKGDLIMMLGERSECHMNVQKLLMAGKIDELNTGLALSADGLWRNHSWGIRGDKIIETTEERIAYLCSAKIPYDTYVKVTQAIKEERISL